MDTIAYGASKLYTDRALLKKPICDFIEQRGAIIDNFDSVSGRTLSGVTAALETQNVAIGSSTGIAITNTVAGSGGNMDTVINLTLGERDVLTFSVYIADKTKISASTAIKVYLGHTSNFANHYVSDIYAASYFQNGWNTVALSRDDFDVGGGSPNWDNPMTAMRIRTSPAAGEIITVIYGTMYKNTKSTPKILFTFDDGLESTFTNGYPVLEKYGIKGTIYAITNNIGVGTGIKLNQLKALYKNGWDVGNHTTDHSDLTSLSLGDATAKIKDAQDYLLEQGFTRSAKYLAYPFGYANATVYQAASDAGVTCGRLTSVLINGKEVLQHNPTYNRYTFRTGYPIYNDATLDGAKSQIDRAIKYGSTLIFITHGVENSSPGTYNALTSTLDSIAAYVAQTGIETMTISEYFNKLEVSKHNF